MRAPASLLLCLGCGLGLLACNAKNTGGPDDDPSLPQGADLSMSLPEDGPRPVIKDLRGASDKDRACASVAATAMLSKKPVDIIFIVDNSGSMTDEIVAVEKNINNNFADIIGKSGLDYQVILLSHNGVTFIDQSICITTPLSGNATCSPPPLCTMPGPHFHQYSLEIASTDSFARILDALTSPAPCGAAPMGFGAWLRPDAFRVFIEITDDNSDMTADDFESQLFAKTAAFGTKVARNYVWHTIAGLHENNPATKPWGPADPIQMTNCTRGGGAVNPGQVYQELSVRTGGLRFPICEHQSFDAVFQNVAQGVVAGARINCDFPVPDPPSGEEIDLDTVRVDYTPGMGAPQMFKKVANAGACAPASFYITGGKIVLCPDACTAVQADGMAKLQILFDCAIKVN